VTDAPGNDRNDQQPPSTEAPQQQSLPEPPEAEADGGAEPRPEPSEAEAEPLPAAELTEPPPGPPGPPEPLLAEPTVAEPTVAESRLGQSPLDADQPPQSPAATFPASHDLTAPEQIEWQPVVTGEHVEWQPVVSSEIDEAAWASESTTPTGEVPPEVPSEPPAAPTWGSEVVAETPDPSPPPQEPVFDYPPTVEPPTAEEPEGRWESAAGVPLDAAAQIAGNGARRGPALTDRPPRRDRRDRRARGDAGGPSELLSPVDEEIDDRRSKTRRQVVLLSVLTAVVVIIGVTAFLLSRGATDKGNAANPAPTSTLATLAPSQLQEFRDNETGFTIKLPRTWRQLGAPLADVRLVADAGGSEGLQVRIWPIDTPATTENIVNYKAFTDNIVLRVPTARLLQQQLVTLNGKLTYYYIYTFKDEASGQEGVHAHYFVFEGNRVFMLVFQAVPAEDFARQAGIFDQVAESFVVEPRPAPTVPATTTTTPPTSAPG
jgi:hypothetical protein